MAWYSIFHDGNSLEGDSGDVGPVSAGIIAQIFAAMFTEDTTAQGVFRANNILGGFVLSGTSSPLTLTSGAGICKGRLAISTASQNVTVDTPDASTRKDRYVLQYLASTNQVRGALVAGTEGGDYPTLTQSATGWEVPMYKVQITTGGVITVTSELASPKLTFGATQEMLEEDTVAVTKCVPAFGGYDTTAAAALVPQSYGFGMADGNTSHCYGRWQVPQDYVSGLNVAAVVQCACNGAATAVAVLGIETQCAADGESWDTGYALYEADTTISKDVQSTVLSRAIGGAVPGDWITVSLGRAGGNGADTLTDTLAFLNFKFTYYSHLW